MCNIPPPVEWNPNSPAPVFAWENSGCSGNFLIAPVDKTTTPWFGVTTVYIPGNTEAKMCHPPPWTSACKTLGPGIYDLQMQAYSPGATMNDRVASITPKNKVPHKQWLADCCFEKNTKGCLNYTKPDGPDCLKLLEEHCGKKENFFGTDCRTWLENLNDSRRNRIARTACSQASTPEEKDLCACFIPRDIPPEFEGDMAIRALWPCLDPVCNDVNKALQPYQKNCPSTLNICKQTDIVTKLQDSEVGSTRIANECGQVKIGAAANAPPSTASATTTQIPKFNRTTIIVAVVVLVVLLLVVFLLGRGRKTQIIYR